MAEVTLKNISKVFDGGKPAVKNVNIEIKDKEFVVLVGPSGCGKSTTLRMIAGLEEITEGDIFIDGKRVNDVSPKDRDIAMVFQNYALYPHMTVFDNMAFGLKLRKFPKQEIRTRVTDAAKIPEAAGVSLQLSGHTHVGQFIPWSWMARRIYRQFVYGLSQIGEMQVFTSSGAGTWGPPLRLGSNSEIVVLEFE